MGSLMTEGLRDEATEGLCFGNDEGALGMGSFMTKGLRD